MTFGGQLSFDLSRRPGFSRDDFFMADCNSEALDQIDRWPDWGGSALCVYGPAGCGKSHLLDIWSRKTNALFLDLGSLTVENFPWLAEGSSVACDGCDDLNKDQILLHLINLIGEVNGYLLMTARSSPADWNVILPDLRSRLAIIKSVKVSRPSDEMLSALFYKLLSDRQVVINSDVVNYLIKRVDRSFAGLQKAFEFCDAIAIKNNQAITIPIVRRVLNQIEMARDKV